MGRFLSEDARAMPKEVFNRRLVFMTLSACMAGSLFGFDTGNIGGVIVLPSFQKTFGLDVDGPNAYRAPTLSANIVSFLQAGCVFGALLAGYIADAVGRRKSLLLAALLQTLGCSLQLVANINSLYVGRVIGGVAVGIGSIVAPMYVSEIAPKAIRGSLETTFNLIDLISLSLAFWINYAVSLWSNPTNAQWRVPIGVQIIPGALLFIGMLFQKESPRFLITNDRYQEGAATLSWARQLPAAHPFVAAELAEISAAVQSEANFMSGNTFGSKIKEIAFVPSVRRRYLLCITCQVFQQMTGTNAINYYAPSIFSSVGLNGTSSTLLATGVYGIVKVVATFVYVVWIIDNIGRRRPLLIGAFIQASCLLYLTIYVALADQKADAPVTAGGYIGIISLYIYALGWSIGWSPLPWLVSSEIMPNRIRALSMATTGAFNWLLNFAITRSTPYMMLRLDKWGAYLIFSLATFVSVLWAFFFFPELKGKSLESMDRLFGESMWIMRRRMCENEIPKSEGEEKKGEVEEIIGSGVHVEMKGE